MDSSIKYGAELFKALGDETRLKIMTIIGARGNNLCVGAIARCLNISQPAVSQHLKVLKNAGVVEANREGFHVHYSLIPEAAERYGIQISDLAELLFKSSRDEDWMLEICGESGGPCIAK